MTIKLALGYRDSTMTREEMQMREAAMMPKAPNDAIRSSTTMLGGVSQRADATYQSSVAIVTMVDYRRDED